MHAHVVALLLLVPVGVGAQSSVAPTIGSSQSPAHTSIPTANPGRPTFTNPADLPPVGYLQFEQGFVAAGASPGLDRQFTGSQVTKLAVSPRVMLAFVSQPFAYTWMQPDRSRDPGDLDVAIQAVLHHSRREVPTVAVAYQNDIRSGTAPDLDIGSSVRSAVLLISGDVGATHYDTNYTVTEQVLDAPATPSVRRAQFGQTLAISHPVFPAQAGSRFALSTELWHATQPLPTTTRHNVPVSRANAVGALAALSYACRPNLVLDTAIDRGLTSTSTRWQYMAGITYLVPHRIR